MIPVSYGGRGIGKRACEACESRWAWPSYLRRLSGRHRGVMGVVWGCYGRLAGVWLVDTKCRPPVDLESWAACGMVQAERRVSTVGKTQKRKRTGLGCGRVAPADTERTLIVTTEARCDVPLSPTVEAVLAAESVSAILRRQCRQEIAARVREGDAKADVARRYGLNRAAVLIMVREEAM